MSIPNTTTEHIDFNDWLDQCPVQWFQEKITEDIAVYVFTLPDTDRPNNPCEFQAVWNYETNGWDILLDQDRCYTTLSHQDLTEFARDHLASNTTPE